jgi:hypothetical protein
LEYHVNARFLSTLVSLSSQLNLSVGIIRRQRKDSNFFEYLMISTTALVVVSHPNSKIVKLIASLTAHTILALMSPLGALIASSDN